MTPPEAESKLETVEDVLGPSYSPYFHPDLAERVHRLLAERNQWRTLAQQVGDTQKPDDRPTREGIAVTLSSTVVQASIPVEGEGVSQEWSGVELMRHNSTAYNDGTVSASDTAQLQLDVSSARRGVQLAMVLGSPRALAPYLAPYWKGRK